MWPSFDPIQFYPKRFRNFPKLLQAYIDKMPSDHPSICTRVTKDGKTVYSADIELSGVTWDITVAEDGKVLSKEQD